MAKKKTYEELLEENLKLNKRIAKMKEKVLKDQLGADFVTMIEKIIETQRVINEILDVSYDMHKTIKNIAYKTRAEYNRWD